MDIRVPLRADEAKQLARLARAKRRTPQDQAADMLARALVVELGQEARDSDSLSAVSPRQPVTTSR